MSHLDSAEVPLHGLGKSTKEMSFPRLSIRDRLSSLVWWEMPLQMAGGLDWGIFEGPFQTNTFYECLTVGIAV